MQLEGMRMEDFSVKNMIELKWRDYDSQETTTFEKTIETNSGLKETDLNTLKLHSAVSTQEGFQK